MLKKVSIGLAVIVCLINEFVKGLYAGFSYGASKMCDTVYPIIEVDGVKSWLTHADPYFYIRNIQVYILFALLIFILGKLAERGIISQLLSLLPLIFSIFFWLWIESIKSIDINEPSKYIDLLRETTNYSWAIISVITILTVLQIITVLKSVHNKHKAKQTEIFC